MTPEQFCYWLQGFNEINGYDGNLTGEQWKIICDHLKTVFHKVTPISGTGGTTIANVPGKCLNDNGIFPPFGTPGNIVY